MRAPRKQTLNPLLCSPRCPFVVPTAGVVHAVSFQARRLSQITMLIPCYVSPLLSGGSSARTQTTSTFSGQLRTKRRQHVLHNGQSKNMLNLDLKARTCSRPHLSSALLKTVKSNS